ncbi:MAG: TIGR04255 family protein [Thermodesulfobacteriota bacterium]|nr:TIGR04255 family protein [Thermodesulfobacteriota bacterium]
MTRPTKITPDPIIDAVVEFRFESEIPPDAILGMLFSVVRNEFPNFTKLPIAEIPEEIRRNDPQLKFAPCYQSISNGYRLNVGPSVISFGNPGEYVGWKENFYPFLQKIINQLEKSGIVKNFLRIGIRYIDFFTTDIFEKITLSIELKGNPLVAKQTTISTIFEQDELTTRVNIQNNTVVTRDKKKIIGSVIDTDTFFEPKQSISFAEVTKLVDKQHDVSLNVFFDLLKQDFLETLNPEY